MATTTASTYDPSKGGINGSPNKGGCGVPSGGLPWSVAHKSAPCGAIVTITMDGSDKIVQVPVADRGPYVPGRDLDLRPDVAAALGSTGLLKVHYAISLRHRVNLAKYAAAGGDAAAFEKMTGLVADSKDKLGAKTDKQAAADAKANSLAGLIPGLNTVNSIGDAVSSIVSALFDASTYLRLGKGLLGGILVILGVGGMVFIVANKVSGSSSVKGVKKVAEVAALA